MSTVDKQPKKSSKNSTIIVGGVIGIAGILLFAYLMWYTTPEEYREMVEVIAVTEDGCIAETFDGFAVNIGDCNVQQGEYIDAIIDKKLKERASAMNPP